VTVTFTESVTGFTAGDITAGNGTVSNFAGSGASYSFDLTPTADGSVTADIAASVAQDAAGNNNTAATQFSHTYDTVAPDVSMSSTASDPTNAVIPVTVTFTESVTGFTAGDITAGNGTVSNFAGSGASYSFDLTPSADGTVTADIAASVAQDLAGNDNTAATQFSRTYDGTAPTVTGIGRFIGANPTNSSSVDFYVAFSESVLSGLDTSDFTLTTTGTISGASVSSVSYFNGTNAAVTVNTGSGDGTIRLDLTDDDSITDAAGNKLGGTGMGNGNYTGDESFTIDKTAPDVSMSSTASDPTNTSPIAVTVTFTESVTGFTSGDVSVSNATLSNFAGSGASYSFDLTPTADGTVTADIAASVAQDAAGNNNTAATQFSRTYDTVAPDGSMSSTANDPTNAVIPVTVTFTESVTGFTAGDITAGNGTVSNFAGSGASYSFDLTPTADGTVTADIAASVAQDAAGNDNTAATQFSRIYDSIAPTTSIDSNPSNPSNSSTAIFYVSGDDGSGSGIASVVCELDGGGYDIPCAAGVLIDNLPEGSHTFSAKATDNAGNTDATPASYTWTIDTTAPTTSIDSSPSNPSNTSAAVFTFNGTDTGGSGVASFACAVDGGGYSACTSGANFGPLGDGSHTFSVKATDNAGNTDASPASYTWTVDTTEPTTSIDSSPANPSNTSAAVFTFSGTDTGGSGVASFACALDGGSYSACTSGSDFGPLADGSHTFSVKASDSADNTDASPASYTWTVDTTVPDTSIDSSPSNPSNTSAAAFAFSSDDVGASFACDLDGGGYNPCTSPKSYTGLADGSHAFSVRATDNAGNTDASPASYTWTIDTTAPTTSIDSSPANPGNTSAAVFAFSGADTGGSGVASFACALDGGSYSACTSGSDFGPLADGSHTFNVRATDNAGNTDASPASYTWTVDTAAPTTSIDSSPSNPSNTSAAVFTFSGTDTGGSGVASFACALDGGGYSACTSGTNFGPLSDGSHTFSVRATDSAGNTDASPASYTWTIDATAPTTSIDSSPSNPSNTSAAVFTFSGTDTGGLGVASFACAVDGGSYSACTSGANFGPLGNGSHTFSVRATDNIGNTDASPASYTWMVDTGAPTVVSITRASTSPINAGSINFIVTFSEPVNSVDTSDFSLTTTGITGASVTSVSGSGATRTVSVSTGSTGGTIRLDIPNTATIIDLAGNALSGLPFTSGQIYIVTKTTTFNSAGAQDGWVLETSETSGVGGSLNSGAATFNLGDDAAKKQYRGILSFSTGSLPDGALITNIMLKVRKSSVVGGGNPVTAFQGFMVEIKKGFFGTVGLQTTDFQATFTAATGKTYGPFLPTPVSNLYSINLTSGKGYINKLSTNGGLTQIRLRFKLDDNNNAIANYLSLFSGNATAANRPQLVITYYVP
jgi:hypothetical protein